MEQTEVTEKKQPRIEVSYTLKKSEKFPSEEVSVLIVEPLYLHDRVGDTEVKKLKAEIETRLRAMKEAVKETVGVD